MNRKTFIKKISSVVFVGIPAFYAASCSSDAEDTPTPSTGDKDCLANGTTASIGSNHGHSLTVSKADVQAGVEKQYNIQGTSSHAHTVTVSADNFATLAGNQSITLTSTTGGGHTHSVTISCA